MINSYIYHGAISRCGGGRDESLTGPNVLFIVWLLLRGKKQCMTVIDMCLQHNILYISHRLIFIVRRLRKDGLAFWDVLFNVFIMVTSIFPISSSEQNGKFHTVFRYSLTIFAYFHSKYFLFYKLQKALKGIYEISHEKSDICVWIAADLMFMLVLWT